MNRRALIATLCACASLSCGESVQSLHLRYTVNFTGAMPLRGSFDKMLPRDEYWTCRQYLVRATADDDLTIEGEVAKHRFELQIDRLQIPGPGSYAVSGKSMITLVFDSGGEQRSFFSLDGGRAGIVVKPDGTGEISISGLTNIGGEREAGTVSWTCQ